MGAVVGDSLGSDESDGVGVAVGLGVGDIDPGSGLLGRAVAYGSGPECSCSFRLDVEGSSLPRALGCIEGSTYSELGLQVGRPAGAGG